MATTLTLRRVGCRLFCLRLRYRRRLRQNKRLYGYAGVVVHRSSAAAPSTSMYSFLELLDDRYATRATVVTSQLPVEQWHAALGDPTLADAILDRLVHNAYRIKLQGPSLRKQNAPAPNPGAVVA